MLFEDVDARCPYCDEKITLPIDPGGGEIQETIVDCEVCCQPIVVRSTWNTEKSEYFVEVDRS